MIGYGKEKSTRERWDDIRKSFFYAQDEGMKYLDDILSMIIDDKKEFPRFIEKVAEGIMYQLAEGYFVHLPFGLVCDGEYHGYVEISWENFDDQDHIIGLVRSDMFYFYVKLAAVFHAKYIDPSFDPWEFFQRFDEMQARYYLFQAS